MPSEASQPGLFRLAFIRLLSAGWRCGREWIGPMDDSEDSDFSGKDLVDYAVGVGEHFANIFSLVFWNH